MSSNSTQLPQASTTFSAYEPTMAMHAEQRIRLVTKLRERDDVAENSIAFFVGGPEPHHYDTDMEPIFRQESFFHYFFGVREPDYFAAVDVRTGTTTLFCPRLPAEFAIWMGEVHGPEHFKAQYGVEDVRYADEVKQWLADRAAEEVHVLKGTNTDSGMSVSTEDAPAVAGLPVVTSVLHPVSVELRVLKTDAEIALMRHTNRLSSMAHMAVMRLCAAGRLESAMEAQFRYYVLANGNCRHLAYTPICASGTNPSTLHYGHAGEPNARTLQEGDMVLNDMGAELHRYASDITCSFPVSGAFSDKQRVIYAAVLDAHKAVLTALKPGVAWPDMQTLAYRTMLGHLLRAGLVKGDVDEMLAADIGAVFMPHGLGHMIGIDTHDVGGYAPGQPERIPRPGYKSLRTARVMQPRMAVTVEPGCYFNRYSLEQAAANEKQAPFLNMETIQAYMSVGGVRIEDNIIITDDGIENLTTCPREIDDVEACCRGEVDHFRAIGNIPGHVHHEAIDA